MVSSLTEIDAFLDSVLIPVRLACKTETDWPIVISLWYRHQNGQLLCATQKSARVVSYLQYDPRCAFEIAEERPPYCGVRGQAIATIDESMGSVVLKQLLQRYLGSTQNSLAEQLLAKSETEVAIILKPIRIFTWDFSDRMRDLIQPDRELKPKVCP
jgi:nitroimidazol reductase NimA-like FMN-containing flavoprotein (pyridoxamine 5'-phosphate oxidase superfamily)